MEDSANKKGTERNTERGEPEAHQSKTNLPAEEAAQSTQGKFAHHRGEPQTNAMPEQRPANQFQNFASMQQANQPQMNFEPDMATFNPQQAGQMTAEQQQHLLNNQFEYYNNQPSKYYRITYRYYPDERLAEKKGAKGDDHSVGQGQARPQDQAGHHYPTFQLIKNQTQLMIQVELKEQYYKYSVLCINLLGIVSRYLLIAFLVSVAQMCYQYNLKESLPMVA